MILRSLKMAQDALKMASRWPKMPSRCPQDGLKMASRWPQDDPQDGIRLGVDFRGGQGSKNLEKHKENQCFLPSKKPVASMRTGSALREKVPRGNTLQIASPRWPSRTLKLSIVRAFLDNSCEHLKRRLQRKRATPLRGSLARGRHGTSWELLGNSW